MGVLDPFRLDGKVTLVAGAGQGIGRAFALALGEAWERYRELMVQGRLCCGITCLLDRMGGCAGRGWGNATG